MFTIITQDSTLAVNYSAVLAISVSKEEVENTETKETLDMFVVVASFINDREPLALGFYQTEEAANEAFTKLLKAIDDNIDKVFTMPE